MWPPRSRNVELRLWCLAASLVCLLGLARVGAEETIFHLRNGDRITGTVVNDAGVELTIQTSFAGRISLPTAQIERREPVPTKAATSGPAPTDSASPNRVNGSPSPPGAGTTSSSTNQASSTNGTAAASIPPPAAPTSAWKEFLKDWHGEAQVGVNVGFSTRDHQTFTGRLRSLYSPNPILRNTLDYIAAYGRTEGVTSENQMDGSWKIERDIGRQRRFLVYNAVGAGFNEIQKVDLRYDMGPGIGYKWLSLTNYSLRTEFGGNYQEQFFQNDTEKSRFSLRLAESMLWQLSKRLRFDNQLEFFPEMENLGDFRIRAEGNLSYAVRDNLTFTVGVIDLYDTAPAPGATKNDLQVRSVIGLRF